MNILFSVLKHPALVMSKDYVRNYTKIFTHTFLSQAFRLYCVLDHFCSCFNLNSYPIYTRSKGKYSVMRSKSTNCLLAIGAV